MKKIALLLSLLLVVGLLPFGAAALQYNGFICDENDNGTLSLYGLDYSIASGEVVVPQQINGKAIVRISDNPFSYKQFITGVTLPSGVTEIADKAFYMCVGLEKIVIPESVKSIGDNCFNLCESLKEITIPGSVESLGGEMFVGCKNLETAYIYSSEASLGENFFDGCESLKSIYLSKGVTAVCVSAIENCPSLTDIYCQGSAENTVLEDAILENKSITVHYEYDYEGFPKDDNTSEELTGNSPETSAQTSTDAGDNGDGGVLIYILVAAGIVAVVGGAAVIKKRKTNEE